MGNAQLRRRLTIAILRILCIPAQRIQDFVRGHGASAFLGKIRPIVRFGIRSVESIRVLLLRALRKHQRYFF
jgi:hypothetical protein